jgi:hypothetical protein
MWLRPGIFAFLKRAGGRARRREHPSRRDRLRRRGWLGHPVAEGSGCRVLSLFHATRASRMRFSARAPWVQSGLCLPGLRVHHFESPFDQCALTSGQPAWPYVKSRRVFVPMVHTIGGAHPVLHRLGIAKPRTCLTTVIRWSKRMSYFTYPADVSGLEPVCRGAASEHREQLDLGRLRRRLLTADSDQPDRCRAFGEEERIDVKIGPAFKPSTSTAVRLSGWQDPGQPNDAPCGRTGDCGNDAAAAQGFEPCHEPTRGGFARHELHDREDLPTPIYEGPRHERRALRAFAAWSVSTASRDQRVRCGGPQSRHVGCAEVDGPGERNSPRLADGCRRGPAALPAPSASDNGSDGEQKRGGVTHTLNHASSDPTRLRSVERARMPTPQWPCRRFPTMWPVFSVHPGGA